MDAKFEVMKKVESCFRQAETFFKVTLSRPRVSFDIRGQDAGRAYYFNPKAKSTSALSSELKFNEHLLENNTAVFLHEIVAHECAHLIVYQLFGRKAKPHGEEWKSIMQGLFGLDARVRHDLDVSELVNKPFIYSCSCGPEALALGIRQHKNIQRGSRYLCSRCQSTLQYAYTKVAESSEKVQKTKKHMDSLYLYCSPDVEGSFSEKLTHEKLLQRLSFILNGYRPEKIFASANLTNGIFFHQWLRKENLLRKFGKGGAFDMLLEKEWFSPSHVIVLANELTDEEKKCFVTLQTQGALLRYLKPQYFRPLS